MESAPAPVTIDEIGFDALNLDDEVVRTVRCVAEGSDGVSGENINCREVRVASLPLERSATKRAFVLLSPVLTMNLTQPTARRNMEDRF